MLEWLHLLGVILVLIVCTAVIIIGLMYEWSLLVTGAPFICMPKPVLDPIVKALDLKDGSVLYDLGCGDGRVLEACALAHPHSKFKGIDKAKVAIWNAKWRLRKRKEIKLLHKNFFKCDLSDATHVFTYLFPDLMNSLLPKLEKELKPGTRLVTCDFTFKDKKWAEEIDLNRPKGTLGRKLYVYIF